VHRKTRHTYKIKTEQKRRPGSSEGGYDPIFTLITVKNPIYRPMGKSACFPRHHFFTAVNVGFYGKRKNLYACLPTQMLPYHDNALEGLANFPGLEV
jgi:hypothetical protein